MAIVGHSREKVKITVLSVSRVKELIAICPKKAQLLT